MGNIYCKDCKYFKITLSEFGADYCDAPELGIVKNYIYGDYKITKSVYDVDYPNKINLGNCPFYKEKNRWFKKICQKILT